MWAGLTVLLRILSFIMAPKLRLSQFACSIGYGFCAWGVSLSLSIIFDELSESPLALPPALPLVLIGLPAAVKQVYSLYRVFSFHVNNSPLIIVKGLIFWEFTAPSPLKIQAHMFPIRLRGFVERNHAMLQYLVWAIPKLLALVVVTGILLFFFLH